MTTTTKTIDGQRFEVNDLLLNFELHHTPQSSYVGFFGLNLEESKFFMQFNNGTAFIYDMPAEEQQAALAAPSIGKYFHAEIKGIHIGEPIAACSIGPALEDEDDFQNEDNDWPDEGDI